MNTHLINLHKYADGSWNLHGSEGSREKPKSGFFEVHVDQVIARLYINNQDYFAKARALVIVFSSFDPSKRDISLEISPPRPPPPPLAVRVHVLHIFFSLSIFAWLTYWPCSSPRICRKNHQTSKKKIRVFEGLMSVFPLFCTSCLITDLENWRALSLRNLKIIFLFFFFKCLCVSWSAMWPFF